ncbi:MAG: DNA-binding protein [Anaeromyxobacter sp. RBG_16_69_14]|nr:MAG: DNA-binding protein [Anaeromyxobacter sp. RBG_16_69_14]
MSEARRSDRPEWPDLEQEQEQEQEPEQEPVQAESQVGADDEGWRGRHRSRTMSRKEIARDLRRQRSVGQIDPDLQQTIQEIEQSRPRSRADCVNGPRPCMFVSCKHHLYLDVNPGTGSIKLNFPDKEIWELGETCALDVADRGGITLEEVGGIMNLTRERIRQVETRGLLKLRAIAEDEPRVHPGEGSGGGKP